MNAGRYPEGMPKVGRIFDLPTCCTVNRYFSGHEAVLATVLIFDCFGLWASFLATPISRSKHDLSEINRSGEYPVLNDLSGVPREHCFS